MDVITTHLNADFDAMASMVAAKKLYPDALLVFPGSQGRTLREFFINSTGYAFNFRKLKGLDLNQVKRLIIVDTRQVSRIGKFASIIGRKDLEIHIYDHHPSSEDDIKGDFEVIKQTGATVTILTQIIVERGLRLSPEEATILMLGLFEDTGSFTFNSTTPDDFLAAAQLLRWGADLNTVSDLVTRELSAEQVGILNELIQSAHTYNIHGVDICITSVSIDKYVGDFAVLVHKLKDIENLDVVFALARMEGRIYLVARSRIPEVNVGEVASYFGGGGHATAASATIRNLTLIEAEDRLFEVLQSVVQPRITARQLMSAPVIFVTSKTSIEEAKKIMVQYNINAMPVVEDGKVRGLVTHQILDKAIYHGLKGERVEEYMNQDIAIVSPDTSLFEIQSKLAEYNRRILPVVEKGTLVGVVTRRDLLNFLVADRSNTPKALYDSSPSYWGRKKNLANLLAEQLPHEVVQLLREIGELAAQLDHRAYIVGGFVRDILMRKPSLVDIDVVIEGDGISFAKAFAERHGIKVRCHNKFNTAVLIFDNGLKIDVATARLEYYQHPAALPVVEFGSLKLDLYRRDFTINALAVALNPGEFGELIDFFGGQQDIKDKVIRALHNLSFVEDPTRILRAIRFEQRFGFKIGKQTASLIRSAVKIRLLKKLKGHRLMHELQCILMEESPEAILKRMDEFEILSEMFPGMRYIPRLEKLFTGIKQVISWYSLSFPDESLKRWWVYFLGLLSFLSPSGRREVITQLEISESERGKIYRVFEEIGALEKRFSSLQDLSPSAVYRALKPLAPEEILLVMARSERNELIQAIGNYFHRYRQVRPDLTGKDLRALGIPPGPIYGRLLDELLDARLDGLVHSREDELEFLKRNHPELGQWLKNDTLPDDYLQAR